MRLRGPRVVPVALRAASVACWVSGEEMPVYGIHPAPICAMTFDSIMGRDLDSFASAGGMETERLREILSTGDPHEGVWAGWELGLRAAGSDELRRLAEGAPHPGTRRHLAVVVAGMGDRPVLESLAKHDPNPSVRSDAIAWLWRCTADPVSEGREIAALYDSDPDPVVRLRIVELQPALPAEFLARILADALTGESVELRTATAQRLLGDGRRCPREVRDRLPEEPDDTLARFMLTAWVHSDDYPLLLQAAEQWPAPLRAQALRGLVAGKRHYSWPSLAKLANEDGLQDLVLDLLTAPYTAETQSWLISLLGLDQEESSRGHGPWREVVRHLGAMRADGEAPPLTASEQAQVRRVEQAVASHDETLDSASDDFDPWDDDMADQRALLRALGLDAGRTDLFER